MHGTDRREYTTDIQALSANSLSLFNYNRNNYQEEETSISGSIKKEEKSIKNNRCRT